MTDVSGREPAPAPGSAERRASILAVDDEPRMGRVIEAALRAHDVVAITSGAEALVKLRAGEHFDIILCDLTMPEMTGMELYETLERELPDQARRVVFLTGGAFTPKSRTFLERVKNLRIDKPFEVAALRAMVTARLREPV